MNSLYFIYNKFVKQYGQNALHWAALNGRFEIVQLLMAGGADIKMKSKVSALFAEIRQVFVCLMIYLTNCVCLSICLSVYATANLSVYGSECIFVFFLDHHIIILDYCNVSAEQMLMLRLSHIIIIQYKYVLSA